MSLHEIPRLPKSYWRLPYRRWSQTRSWADYGEKPFINVFLVTHPSKFYNNRSLMDQTNKVICLRGQGNLQTISQILTQMRRLHELQTMVHFLQTSLISRWLVTEGMTTSLPFLPDIPRPLLELCCERGNISTPILSEVQLEWAKRSTTRYAAVQVASYNLEITYVIFLF